MVYDYLRAIHEIAELRLPKHKGFGIIAAEAIFETDTARFRQRRVGDFDEELIGREVRKRDVFLFGFRVDQNGVALIEGAALRVLPGEADRIAFENDRA